MKRISFIKMAFCTKPWYMVRPILANESQTGDGSINLNRTSTNIWGSSKRLSQHFRMSSEGASCLRDQRERRTTLVTATMKS